MLWHNQRKSIHAFHRYARCFINLKRNWPYSMKRKRTRPFCDYNNIVGIICFVMTECRCIRNTIKMCIIQISIIIVIDRRWCGRVVLKRFLHDQHLNAVTVLEQLFHGDSESTQLSSPCIYVHHHDHDTPLYRLLLRHPLLLLCCYTVCCEANSIKQNIAVRMALARLIYSIQTLTMLAALLRKFTSASMVSIARPYKNALRTLLDFSLQWNTATFGMYTILSEKYSWVL